MLQHFRFSLAFSAVCLGLAAWWGLQSPLGLWTALWLTAVLAVLEVSLSFDNAVVNASVLRGMSRLWQQLFLTVGILIAVFGMRLVFPIVIVAVAADLGWMDTVRLALQRPDEYSRALTSVYPVISAFGGTFLLLVFLNFLFDADKETHWLGVLERRMVRAAKFDEIAVFVALLVVFSTRWWVPEAEQNRVFVAGIAGILLYLAVDAVGALFEDEDEGRAAVATVQRSGFAGFLYLEVLDASFSFDGVIGAFAITKDVVIIMLGLAIGAIFVRSMTVYLVRRGTLQAYRYLEHGAHYAIGALAAIMLMGTVVHVPEAVTGLIGVAFIAASVLSSVRERQRAAG
ncbi:integral membrane protein, YkoY family [Tepidimonas alkaliphilus]|uniref:Integral membrane protein, YkoY family n=1 Tax=Tepidimonas alkaliphilus TaxID=2588942 RepID=A0A554W5I4_9BURK|nr:integral membrane protein, YkoY family [Tepidimonas alkaliphilus]